jgi:small-conductance mechanosensitive channel
LDRRLVGTLRTVTRVAVQVFAVLLILLVIFGPPGQLGTFLGLAGAGLTVALKDFIVGFFGWFTLMGKNGIRLGDWVEINGVTGEVIELGIFRTVLLETGNWTASGHPTGRRVTFGNSYAIEGHYFNFSTSGQWLWDELQVVLPLGQDPYALVDALKKKVLEATAETAKQAEQEWRGAASSRDLRALPAAPAINLKPAVGGSIPQIKISLIQALLGRMMLKLKCQRTAFSEPTVNAALSPSSIVLWMTGHSDINGLPAEVPSAAHDPSGGICYRLLTRDQRPTAEPIALNLDETRCERAVCDGVSRWVRSIQSGREIRLQKGLLVQF